MMKYVVTQLDFHYRPGEDDGEIVIYTNEINTKASTIKKVLEECASFVNVFQEVEVILWCEGTIVLRSNMNSQIKEHPEHFYTQRHELHIEEDEDEDD